MSADILELRYDADPNVAGITDVFRWQIEEAFITTGGGGGAGGPTFPAWDSGTAYDEGDTVNHEFQYWVSTGVIVGAEPGTGDNGWLRFPDDSAVAAIAQEIVDDHVAATDPHGDRAAAATDATTKANAAQAAAIAAIPESARDAVGTALIGTSPVSVTLNDGADTITIAVGASTTTASGIVELATSAETITGTDTARAVTPAGLAATVSPILSQPAASALADADKLPVGQSGALQISTLSLLADYMAVAFGTRNVSTRLASPLLKAFNPANTNFASFETAVSAAQDAGGAGIKSRSTFTNFAIQFSYVSGFFPPGIYARADGTDAAFDTSFFAQTANTWLVGNGGTIQVTTDPIVANDLTRRSYVTARTKNSPASATLGRTGCIVETIPRAQPITNSAILASGTLYVIAVELKAGDVVTNITWMSRTTALSAATNQWSCLLDSSRVVKAVSADGTSGAWSANALKTFAMGTPFTILTNGLYYLGLMVAATTVPTLNSNVATVTTLTGQAPVLHGASSTGQTTPPALAATMGAVTTGNVGIPWADVT